MQSFFSPIINSFLNNGLQYLLFSSEEERDFHSNNLANKNDKVLEKGTKENQEKIILNQPQQFAPKTFQANSIKPQSNIEINQTRKIQKNPTLTLDKWPKKWLGLHKHFKLPAEENIGKVQIVWTYSGLEQDSFGQADFNRRNIVKKLLSDLNHQSGTHVFIPYANIDSDGQSEFAKELVNNEEISFFWSAMRLVRPRILLIFGSVARDAISAPKSLPLQKTQMGSLQILQMHKFETLAEDQDLYNNTLIFLQSYLHFCKKK